MKTFVTFLVASLVLSFSCAKEPSFSLSSIQNNYHLLEIEEMDIAHYYSVIGRPHQRDYWTKNERVRILHQDDHYLYYGVVKTDTAGILSDEVIGPWKTDLNELINLLPNFMLLQDIRLRDGGTEEVRCLRERIHYICDNSDLKGTTSWIEYKIDQNGIKAIGMIQSIRLRERVIYTINATTFEIMGEIVDFRDWE